MLGILKRHQATGQVHLEWVRAREATEQQARQGACEARVVCHRPAAAHAQLRKASKVRRHAVHDDKLHLVGLLMPPEVHPRSHHQSHHAGLERGQAAVLWLEHKVDGVVLPIEPHAQIEHHVQLHNILAVGVIVPARGPRHVCVRRAMGIGLSSGVILVWRCVVLLASCHGHVELARRIFYPE
jgi:hypothetical protein